MAESNTLLKGNKQSAGSIHIAPRVLEIIASIAAVKVPGVERMQGSFATGVNELFGHKDFGKGIKLSFNDQDQVSVDIYVYVDYGVSVPKVALEIQDKVKQQLLFMTELDVLDVNVHIEGIVHAHSESKIDPDDLFADNDNSKGE
ncbi:Asp23/Gls24 family envelope stress response protein [Lactobacillus sp. Sy-1]|uniref:Asp23/Gls24 family envelope stress response protein n=1 Tax=Lactobacillus sp. Sy-1 TaxID=2109645 RepID=UPI001C57679B|nr:Asp23/Gls24 family envelope stress response protein [Lactobacillus sp. Sy-1]MBW1605645.1 Asp23/Gls24 family envelope stress response protein [Lactobacillus sp. Sy-1]